MMEPQTRPAQVTGLDAAADDATLLAAVGLGRNPVAFEELYRRHLDAVTHVAMDICCNETMAEEIAQATFARFWERAGRLASRAVPVWPWLLTVTRSAAFEHLRAESPYLPIDAQTEACGASLDPQAQDPMNELIADLAPALASLSSKQRLVIELRYFEGMSFRAIAERTGETLATVKSHAARGLEQLRRIVS